MIRVKQDGPAGCHPAPQYRPDAAKGRYTQILTVALTCRVGFALPDATLNTPHDQATIPAAAPRPRQWPWALLVVLILAASIGGYIALQVFKPTPSIKPLVRQTPIVRVTELQARSGGLPVIGSGLIEPRRQVTLAAEVQARVIQISENLVTGGKFEQDEVLLMLDPAPFEAALAQATADTQSAKAALALAEQSIKRTRNLIAQGFLSRQTLDERVANRDQARAALARATAIENQRGIDLARTTITAPFSGRVLSESVSVGDTAQPGRELARLFDDTVLEVAISLTGKDMSLIDDPWGLAKHEGATPAVIQVTHGEQIYEWDAQVDRVEAAIDNTTRTFNIVVRPSAPGQPGRPIDGNTRAGPPLLVGMYATARIAGRDLGRYYLLPRRALRNNDQVWIATAEQTVAIVAAEVLTEIDDQVAVKLALENINALGAITSDLKVVTPGMQIRAAGTNADTGASTLPGPEASAPLRARPL